MAINRLNQQQLNSVSCTALNQSREEIAQLLNNSLPNNQPQQPFQPVKPSDYAEMGALNSSHQSNYQQFQQPPYQTLPNQARSSSYHQRHSGSQQHQQQQNMQTNNQLSTELNLSYNLIENDIKEIRDYLRHTRKKLENTDLKTKQTNEWKQVALVLDRTLFFIYIIAIIVSVIVMFPR